MPHFLPKKNAPFVGKAPKQQGYVLLIAMMLLVLLAAPFFYQSTLQTTNQMQQALYERQESKLKALKEKIILYAKYPGMACDPTDSANDIPALQDSPEAGTRGLFVFKDHEDNIIPNMMNIFSEYRADQDQIFFDSFDDDSDDPNYEVTSCADYPKKDDDKNACQANQNLLMRIYWSKDGTANTQAQADEPVVYLYQSDLDC